jgi:hypothetical protein
MPFKWNNFRSFEIQIHPLVGGLIITQLQHTEYEAGACCREAGNVFHLVGMRSENFEDVAGLVAEELV